MNATRATAARVEHAAAPSRHASGHGAPLRGLTSASSSLKPGRFGKLFPKLPPADYGDKDEMSRTNLRKLGMKMAVGAAASNYGPDDQESGIPALYTYFGEFIDHDITFDPASSMQKQKDPEALVDYRTSAFDLDSLYGRGPVDQPYMYDDPDDHSDGSAQLFLLGSPIFNQRDGDAGEKKPDGWDLPRNRVNNVQRRALIGDPRNDGHTIISQLHGLFLRFHNRIAQAADKPSFAEVQQRVRFHYQYLVLQDFLPRVVHSDVLKELRTGGRYDRKRLKFFRWKAEPFMPLEFSVAAYRVGHPMVRSHYWLNDGNKRPMFSTSKPDDNNPNPDLMGFQSMPATWALDWPRFIDTEKRPYSGAEETVNKRRLQFAFKIGTSLVDPLFNLPDGTPLGKGGSLAQRNLLRAWSLRLPSGQSVAHAMGVAEVLKDEDILIGKDSIPIAQVNSAFKGNCPLWTYVLAEAMHHQEKVQIPVTPSTSIMTPKLGPVGGRIVAEVFLGLMFGDPSSVLNYDPNWQPLPGSSEPYMLKDFVHYALGK